MNGTTREFLAAVRSGEIGVAVWGCGHIGASALFHLALAGARCVGYDVLPERAQAIREGRFLSTAIAHPPPPRATPDTAAAPLRVEAFDNWRDLAGRGLRLHLICVPTDHGRNPSPAALVDLLPHLCAVIREDLARQGEAGRWPFLISIESTIVPSWIDQIVLPALADAGFSPDMVQVCAAPRRDWFSGESHTLRTLPRIVGAMTPEATALIAAFYSLICATVVPARDARHAALVKVVENALRYHDISFANALALDLPGYDTAHVLALASTKWNIQYYHPSLGIGGHCIPLAPRYLLAEAGGEGRLAPVEETLAFNEAYFARLYSRMLGGLLEGCRRVAVLGLAYTPDARMEKLSPAFDVIKALARDGKEVHLHDPYYSAGEIQALAGVASLAFPADLAQYDGVVLVTAHTPYVQAEVERHVAPRAVIIDNFGTWRERRFPPEVRYHEVGAGR